MVPKIESVSFPAAGNVGKITFMNKLLVGLLIVTSLSMGCRKKSLAVSTTPAHPPVPVILATPQQAATATLVTGPEADAVNIALQMSAPVAGFPTDLSTLVDGKSVTKIPTPPPGKKLGIDQVKMRLILLNE